MNINKVLRVEYNEESDFFIKWIEYLAPKHHLTKSEQKFLAACLRQRHELSKSITDENLLDETALSKTYRDKIRQEAGLGVQQAHNIVSKLKSRGILIPKTYPFSDKLNYYKISPSFIPDYVEDKDFTLLFVFRKNGERNTDSSI